MCWILSGFAIAVGLCWRMDHANASDGDAFDDKLDAAFSRRGRR